MTAGDKTFHSILEAGRKLWPSVTARGVARELGMTHGAVLYHCRRAQASLPDLIAAHAVSEGDGRIIVHLIATQHKAVAHFDDALRLAYLRQAAGSSAV